MVDAVIAVYLTNQRAGSPPGLVAVGPQGGKYYQENCRKKMGATVLVTCTKIGCNPPWRSILVL